MNDYPDMGSLWRGNVSLALGGMNRPTLIN